MVFAPSEISIPQLVSGGWTPKPKKLKNDSNMMKPGTMSDE
ncbi:hypothetical protein A79_6204 [Vibrio parahaemolyticus AQ3810]|nr:hypothetical protein A79_6204 [Vibrio parahaemolyticus AQ3810]